MGPGMRPLSHGHTRASLTSRPRSTSERTPTLPSNREDAAPSCNGLMTRNPLNCHDTTLFFLFRPHNLRILMIALTSLARHPTTADRSPAGRGARRGILKNRLLALHDPSTATRVLLGGICFDYWPSPSSGWHRQLHWMV